jgi:hypothetical protein
VEDLLPLTLLFLFGGFAALSAVLKSRARVRALSAIVLAVLEGLSGMTLMVAAIPGSGSIQMASRIAIVTAALVAVSSTVHLMKVRERSRAREASEGKRLAAAVQYPVDDGSSATGVGTPRLDLATEVGPPGPDLATEVGPPASDFGTDVEPSASDFGTDVEPSASDFATDLGDGSDDPEGAHS